MSRLEKLGEHLRARLNQIAATDAAWLAARAPQEWFERYGRRIADARLPRGQAKRTAYGEQIGKDGMMLLQAVF